MSDATGKQEIAKKPKNKGGNPNWQKGMKSPNAKGRPPAGESRGEMLWKYWNKTPDQIAKLLGENDLGRMFKNMPKGIAVGELIALRLIADTMFEPSGAIVSLMLDAMYGKQKTPVEHSGDVHFLMMNDDD